MSDIKVSVVIVNYNVKDLILTCIQSLVHFHTETPKIEIIVVDNNSKDGSCAAIRERFPQKQTIKVLLLRMENLFSCSIRILNSMNLPFPF